MEVLSPPNHLHGRWGHGWEQFILPQLVGDRLLWNPANTGPVLRRVSRQVLTLHDVTQLDSSINPKTFRYYEWIATRLVERSIGILTPSEFSKRSIVEKFRCSEALVRAVPLAIDHDKFKLHSPYDIERTLSSFGLRPGYLLTLASTSPRKNIRATIEAWALAVRKLPSTAKLVIAGDIPDLGNLNTSGVEVIGRIPDEQLPHLMAGAQAFIFASLSEGFGLPPLEAMACGTPCIVSQTTSLPEVVGSAAAFIDPSDISSIAEGILHVLTDETYRTKLRSAGLVRASAFTWQRTADLTAEFLHQA